MSKPPPIQGVAEIVLSVNDLKTMKTFYTRVLGFELFSESCHESGAQPEPGEPTIVFLKIADLAEPFGTKHPQLLVLIDYQRHAAARARFSGHDVKTSTLNHLAFQISPADFENHLNHLQACNIETQVVTFFSMDAKAIFFRDPEGNQLELICHSLPETTDA